MASPSAKSAVHQRGSRSTSLPWSWEAAGTSLSRCRLQSSSVIPSSTRNNHPFSVEFFAMNYSQLFPQDDITIPIPNPTQHPSAPVQMLRRESYNTMNDGMNGPTGGAANHSQGQLVSPLEDVEEMDTSSRPRLTQEQIAILEDQFKGKPKPGTDFKKVLAAQIGLSLQRVNVRFFLIFFCGQSDLFSHTELVPKSSRKSSSSKTTREKI